MSARADRLVQRTREGASSRGLAVRCDATPVARRGVEDTGEDIYIACTSTVSLGTRRYTFGRGGDFFHERDWILMTDLTSRGDSPPEDIEACKKSS